MNQQFEFEPGSYVTVKTNELWRFISFADLTLSTSINSIKNKWQNTPLEVKFSEIDGLYAVHPDGSKATIKAHSSNFVYCYEPHIRIELEVIDARLP